jgi:hypothetical protein
MNRTKAALASHLASLAGMRLVRRAPADAADCVDGSVSSISNIKNRPDRPQAHPKDCVKFCGASCTCELASSAIRERSRHATENEPRRRGADGSGRTRSQEKTNDRNVRRRPKNCGLPKCALGCRRDQLATITEEQSNV